MLHSGSFLLAVSVQCSKVVALRWQVSAAAALELGGGVPEGTPVVMAGGDGQVGTAVASSTAQQLNLCVGPQFLKSTI